MEKNPTYEELEQLVKDLKEEAIGRKPLEEEPEKAKVKNGDVDQERAEVKEQLEQTFARADEMAEEPEAARKARSNFLANMSHEIRTPMNAVMGFTDMLLDTNLDENQADYAKTIKSSGEALMSLLNDILDFSKIEERGLDFEEIDFDPELIAYDVCEQIRPRIGLKPIEILCHIGDNVPPHVMGDPMRLRQALSNLMGNAAKFTDSGEIELSLDIEEEKDDKLKLHAIVRDTGIGIPQENLARIFEAFQHADSSISTRFGGAGLGLAICKQISRIMDGDVWAESLAYDDTANEQIETQDPYSQMDGPGSTFHFTGWLKKAEGKESKRSKPVSLSGKKVLIVDDNQTNLDILTHVLQLISMRLVALKDGEEVIPTLQEAVEAGSPFDICISDIRMPGTSGYDVAAQIRDPQHQFSALPLIALSSLTERDAEKCEEVGFNGFLSKPFHRVKLFQMMERILGETEDEQDEAVKRKIKTQYSVKEEIKHSVRILLAEDNPVNQKLAKIMLTKAGYEVDVANDGQEAVHMYTSSPEDFNLIFMDIKMPEIDGIEATRVIRESGFDSIPIIAMTAAAMKGDREKCLDAGMDDYITKPIKRDLVFQIIEKWVFKKEE